MVLNVFLILFFLLIIFLLFMPVVLNIDTLTNQYDIELKGLAKASLMGHKDELLKIRLNILFLNFEFYPLRKKASSPKKIKSRDSKKSKIPISLQTGLRLLKSFKVKKLFVDIDTGNCITNAKLYPCFALLNYNGGHFKINFEGRNRLLLCIQNRPIFIIKSFINF